MRYTAKQIENLLHAIEDGRVTTYNLPEDLYKAITDHLKKGVFKGYGITLDAATGPDRELLTNLTENVYMFGAAKTYQQTKAISAELVDENGKVRTSAEFQRIGRKMFEEWNDNWGKAEYNTAIGQAQMVSKWAEIDRQKDIMPNLTYEAIGDACAICRPLDGITAPVGSAIWNKISPLNHYNCFCILLQKDETVSVTDSPERIVDTVVEKMNPVFLHNPYRTGQIFPKEHPYFDVPEKDKKFAQQNFGLPIPDLNKFVLAKSIKEAESRIKELGVGNVNLSKLKIGEANIVVKVMESEYAFSPFKLDELVTYRKAKAAEGAYYSPTTNKLAINASSINKFTPQPVVSFQDRIEMIQQTKKKYLADFVDNPKYDQYKVQKHLRAMDREIVSIERKIKLGLDPLPFTLTELGQTNGESFEMLFTHEMGHNRHYKQIGIKTTYTTNESDAPSDYAKTNHKEYLAEMYVKFRHFGDAGIPDDILKLFKNLMP